MKNTVNNITALERIKTRYDSDEDIKIILGNFKMFHKKYSEEVVNKRTLSATLIYSNEKKFVNGRCQIIVQCIGGRIVYGRCV